MDGVFQRSRFSIANYFVIIMRSDYVRLVKNIKIIIKKLNLFQTSILRLWNYNFCTEKFVLMGLCANLMRIVLSLLIKSRSLHDLSRVDIDPPQTHFQNCKISAHPRFSNKHMNNFM